MRLITPEASIDFSFAFESRFILKRIAVSIDWLIDSLWVSRSFGGIGSVKVLPKILHAALLCWVSLVLQVPQMSRVPEYICSSSIAQGTQAVDKFLFKPIILKKKKIKRAINLRIRHLQRVRIVCTICMYYMPYGIECGSARCLQIHKCQVTFRIVISEHHYCDWMTLRNATWNPIRCCPVSNELHTYTYVLSLFPVKWRAYKFFNMEMRENTVRPSMKIESREVLHNARREIMATCHVIVTRDGKEKCAALIITLRLLQGRINMSIIRK